MLCTTLLVENSRLFDPELHERRLNQALPLDKIKAHLKENKALQGRFRLRINEDLSFALERVDPYDSRPWSLRSNEDEGLFVKTVESCHSRKNLKVDGFDDVLTLKGGVILQSSFANLFWIDGQTLKTPDYKSLPIVEGTSIKRVLESALLLNLTPQLVRASVSELQGCPLFLTNAVKEIIPIGFLDSRPCPLDEALLGSLLGQYRAIRYRLSWKLV